MIEEEPSSGDSIALCDSVSEFISLLPNLIDLDKY